MTIITDEERRAEYVALMGPELGDLHHDLENEAAFLIRKWDDFDELFNDDEDQLALLNQVASNFFHFLQLRWYEDAMLHISRLTDRPESGGRRQSNLTVQRLTTVIADSELTVAVDAAVAAALVKSEFARVWRDKRLAHADLYLSGKHSLAGLPVATRVGVRNAIDAICEPTRLIAAHFRAPLALASFRDRWGVQALLHHLRLSVSNDS